MALDLSMTELARRVKRPRESVSRAVNHGRNPHVLAQVREVLGV
jgi:predicted transcriptional regulator